MLKIFSIVVIALIMVTNSETYFPYFDETESNTESFFTQDDWKEIKENVVWMIERGETKKTVGKYEVTVSGDQFRAEARDGEGRCLLPIGYGWVKDINPLSNKAVEVLKGIEIERNAPVTMHSRRMKECKENNCFLK